MKRVVAGAEFERIEPSKAGAFFKKGLLFVAVHLFLTCFSLKLGVAIYYQLFYSVLIGGFLIRYFNTSRLTKLFLFSPFEDLFMMGIVFFVLPDSFVFLALSYLPIDHLIQLDQQNAWPRHWISQFLYSYHRLPLEKLTPDIDASLFCISYLFYFTALFGISTLMAGAAFSRYWVNLIKKEKSPHQWLFIILTMSALFLCSSLLYLHVNPPFKLSQYSPIFRSNDLYKKILVFSIGPSMGVELLCTGIIGYIVFIFSNIRGADGRHE